MLLGIRSLVLVLGGVCCALSLTVQAQSKAAIAAQGYIYGFPLVLMGETLDGLSGPERVCGLGTDINTFAHVFERPDAAFKAVVRPNVDTLYSSAMLDLSAGPQLLAMPAVQDRYVLMALLDAWSNNFAGIGTQSHGAEAGHYAIVGPGWEGALPAGYVRIDAPTNLVWVIGRTEVHGDNDIAVVNDIQRQYTLTPWGYTPPSSEVNGCLPASLKTPPIDVVKSLNATEFFSRLSNLIQQYPPPASDEKMLKRLAKIGVGPYAEISVAELNRREKAALGVGRQSAQGALNLSTQLLGLTGWGPNPKWIPLGDYGQRYFIRAVVAQVGFGANRGEYAVYQNASRDAHGRKLNGKSVYTMTFAAGSLPPVKAFWSLTAYAEDGFLRDNPTAQGLGLQTPALGSNSDLMPNADGSITLYLSAVLPEGVPLSNWLPTPEDQFEATIRLYEPTETILQNHWRVPALVRVFEER